MKGGTPLNKIQTLNAATNRLERMTGDVSSYLPWHAEQLKEAHREIKSVRDRLSHEHLMARQQIEVALTRVYR